MPPASSASKRASSAPATVQPNPEVKLNLPKVEGLVWETAFYQSGGVDYEYVIPQRRLRQPVNDKGENEGESSYLNYRHDQAYGNYELINFIFFENIGISQLKKIDIRWPPKPVPSNEDAFLKLLRARKVPGGGSLENLLDPPQRHQD